MFPRQMGYVLHPSAAPGTRFGIGAAIRVDDAPGNRVRYGHANDQR